MPRCAQGRFLKGASGNPGGSPRVLRARIAAVRDAALDHAPKAIARLAALIDSEDGKVAIGASLAILERAAGKPAAGAPPDDRLAKLQEKELATRSELQAARARELDFLATIEALRQQVEALTRSAVQ